MELKDVANTRVSNTLARSLDELSQVYSLRADGLSMSEAFYIVKETQAIMKRMANMAERLSKENK